jgi:hypothetical protein
MIDGALCGCYRGISGMSIAGLVFLMPKFKIGAMQVLNRSIQFVRCRAVALEMPERGPIVVQIYDARSIQAANGNHIEHHTHPALKRGEGVDAFPPVARRRYTGGDMKIDTGHEIILCISTHKQGDAFLRELAHLGCRVVLLTVEELRDADWPREALHEFQTMPSGMTREQITNTVTYLARTRKFARVIALDGFDMELTAALREHMRVPGMGITTSRYFSDKLAMRGKAAHLGIRVPAFAAVLNYDDLREYMESVPAPWLLGPRTGGRAFDAQTLQEAEEVWRALEKLGDRQSDFLLEQSIPGDTFSMDGITAAGKVSFSAAHPDGDSPALNSQDEREVKAIHAELIPALGMMRGVSHTKFLRSHASGKLYFLEAAAWPGAAPATEADGIDLWVEWARVEIAALRGETYRLP